MAVVAVIYFNNGILMVEHTAVISGWVPHLETKKKTVALQELSHLRTVGK